MQFRKLLRAVWESSIPAVAIMVALATFALATGLHAITYAQGGNAGCGTLPNRGFERRTSALSAWQVLRFDADSGASAVIGSTHDAEQTPAPDQSAQTMTATWRYHHTTLTLSTPRWTGETDDHWRTRHAESLVAMQTRFPADDTCASVPATIDELLRLFDAADGRVYVLDQARQLEVPPLIECALPARS